jgi:hypothetical protein
MALVVSEGTYDIVLDQRWEISPIIERNGEKFFSADFIVDAFLAGKKTGEKKAIEEVISAEIQVQLEKLTENVQKAQSLVEDILVWLHSNEFKCDDVYMRIRDFSNYDVLFRIAPNNFVQDSFLNAYTHVRNLRKEKNTTTFEIEFNFMPATHTFNSSKLMADGYNLKRHASN